VENCRLHEKTVWGFCGDNPKRKWGIGPEGESEALHNCIHSYTEGPNKNACNGEGGIAWDPESRTITKSRDTASYDSHAVSESRVQSVSVKVGQVPTSNYHVRVGLSDDSSESLAKYQIGAFWVGGQAQGRIFIPEAYEAGTHSVGVYNEASQLEVAIVDGNVVALLDGVEIYNWGAAPAPDLFAKVSPHEYGASVTDVVLQVAPVVQAVQAPGGADESLEMVELGVGSCDPHSATSVLRKETQPDLDSCKAACLKEKDCSYITYGGAANSCSIIQGIPCALIEDDMSLVTYGNPLWFFSI
jgi:hypothetical protein